MTDGRTDGRTDRGDCNIPIAFLKKRGDNKRYAMDKIILKTRSEVKVKVTVTQKWYMTLRYPKMHPHTKFGIPNSKNIRDMLWTQ